MFFNQFRGAIGLGHALDGTPTAAETWTVSEPHLLFVIRIALVIPGVEEPCRRAPLPSMVKPRRRTPSSVYQVQPCFINERLVSAEFHLPIP